MGDLFHAQRKILANTETDTNLNIYLAAFINIKN